MGRALADRLHRRIRLRAVTPDVEPSTTDQVRPKRDPRLPTLRARIGRLPTAARVTPYQLRRGWVW
jgi:hypothetical protein